MGSSPRMRGTRCVPSLRRLACGIIPAHAGNTQAASGQAADHGDHPRACGEHVPLARTPKTMTGSSPRMRGTLIECDSGAGILGIIPAHAGNTILWPLSPIPIGDHPRACGEHAKKLARYQGIRLRISVFSFSFTLSTSSPFDICWHYSNHAEEYQRMMLPSFL